MTYFTTQQSSFRLFQFMIVVVVAVALSGCARTTGEPVMATWPVPPLPDTPAGQQLDAYLKVFNTGDQDAIKQFVAEHFSPNGPDGPNMSVEQRIGPQLRLYDSSRGLNLYEVAESKPNAVTVIVQYRLTQEWRRITFMVEDTPPNLVSGIMMMPADAPDLTNIASGTAQAATSLHQDLDAYLQNLVAADRFSGVVLVTKDGKTLFEGAYGMANKERQIANHKATRFNYASVGKMFTAMAIGQLVEAGKVAYDAPLGTYLPDYPAEIAQHVTVEHLLTHRSGLVDYFADEQLFETVKNSRDPQRDYQAIFKDKPLRFAPGNRFEYSNSNYIVLGAIVEQVSGQPYADYIAQHVFAPAGMTETTFGSEGIDPALLAVGYTELGADGNLHPGERHLFDGDAPAVGGAAGGGYTTVGDLVRFATALRGGKLLSPEATDALLADRVDYERPGYRYGYGFIVRKDGDQRIVGHSGGFPGVDAQFEMYMDDGYTVAVLSNYELVAEPITMHVQQLFHGAK